MDRIFEGVYGYGKPFYLYYGDQKSLHKYPIYKSFDRDLEIYWGTHICGLNFKKRVRPARVRPRELLDYRISYRQFILSKTHSI